MSGIKVTNERPARAIADIESVDGTVVDEDVDWEPDTTTGIPPGGDPGDVLTWDGDSWEPEPPTGGTSSLPWFIVTAAAYGATGDGVTNDTAAINLAIAALNSADRGVLYFPAGTYVTSGALTTITAQAIIMGDGVTTSASGPGTNVTCTSATASLFTVSANGCTFRDITLTNTNVGTKTAGAGITTTGGILAGFERCVIVDFYTGVDIENSTSWFMRDCYMQGAYLYGIRIRNTSVPDNGDWVIESTTFTTTHGGTSAIRVDSSGGGKIIGCKINGGTTKFVTGIEVVFASVASTILLVDATSIENVSGDAINISTTGTGQYGSIAITGCQVGLYSNNTGRAVKITAASTGGQTTSGGIGVIVIDGCVFHTSGTARAAVELTKTDSTTLGDIQLSGFNARYTSTSDTNTTDGSTPSFATPAVVLGTAAAAGAASTVIRSDSTIVAFDATVPTTQALGDAAATGSAAFAARRDHKHAMPALSSVLPLVESGAGAIGSAVASSREDHVHPAASASAAHYLVVASSHSTPLIFGDLVQTSAGDDLIYTS